MVSSTVRNVTFAVFLLTFVLFVVAFSTPWWVTTKVGSLGGGSIGLWMSCSSTFFDKNKWHCGTRDLKNTDDETKATQAMMCLAVLANLAALVLFFAWMCKKHDGSHAMGAGGACLLGGVLNVIAVAVFGNHYSSGDNFDWSFILACISASLGTLDGLLTVLAVACGRR